MNPDPPRAEGPAPLTVITVTYSPGPHLARLAASLPAATRRPVHLVLADNGSVDGAPEELAAPGAGSGPAEVTLVRTGGNLGYGAACNAALRRLRRQGRDPGAEVLLVNPDVRFRPGAIDIMLATMARRPRAALVGPAILEPDGSRYPSAREVPRLGTGIGHALLGRIRPGNRWSRAYRGPEADGRAPSGERTAGWLSGSCLLMRTAALAELGGFDERYFMYFEDVDLGDRAGRAGWECVYQPAAVITHDKGHCADADRNLPATTAAHHASARRFMADRLPGPARAPLRLALGLGLGLRLTVLRLLARRRITEN